jgi:hypothetical protein
MAALADWTDEKSEHGAAVFGKHENMHSGRLPKYVPGFLDVVDGWLRGHIR